jgi:hypothetical protein
MDRCVGAAARLPESDRKDLAVQALARSATVSDLSTRHGVSRKFVYQQANKARHARWMTLSSPPAGTISALHAQPACRAYRQEPAGIDDRRKPSALAHPARSRIASEPAGLKRGGLPPPPHNNPADQDPGPQRLAASARHFRASVCYPKTADSEPRRLSPKLGRRCAKNARWIGARGCSRQCEASLLHHASAFSRRFHRARWTRSLFWPGHPRPRGLSKG